MNSDPLTVAIGISQIFPCSYLANQQEQLLVIQQAVEPEVYERLLAVGFRRSGQSIYQPRCPQCNACQPIRVNSQNFTLSTRHKRNLRQAQHLSWKLSYQTSSLHYPLYEKYICLRHSDGSMFPPSQTQYQEFLLCDWLEQRFIEVYDGDKLIGVAVTDCTPNSLSAVYSFFDPDYEPLSIGNLLILKQLQTAKQESKSFVYLGYQIDANRKMCYKRQFRPYEILTTQGWVASTKI
ncbi:arginyltransferase [Shewanella sp. NIFS-20-20]|uniref:arginyltransferase n=1 Tax=Shewanella sp. NIFS-20-20 TaxID=2853806 RepID=UPI001C46DB2A|nr:arginyltransferase [Shewanella sp. NIFS-20-20]MBV7314584.1 arginyltransferase [Shewanella sp. NIFS-20-20]